MEPNKKTITFAPTIKQWQMFQAFDDDVTTEILYGGSAGSAKSYGLCGLLIRKCLEYPKIRIGLARQELTILKKTTMTSFMEVADDWGVTHLFNYNSSAGIIKFKNGSEIVLCELKFLPSDPEYTRLGGLLFTFGVVDEIGEVDEKGYSIFKSRLGRWKNSSFGIKAICVSTCNPIKNWLYKTFYQKYVDGTLENYKMFIPALPSDNPHLPKEYLDSLSKLPHVQRERLLYGNWEYEDAEDALMTYETINEIFLNINQKEIPSDQMYITADIAFTSDKMVIMVWKGLTVIRIDVNPSDDNIEEYIFQLARHYKVPMHNIAYDSDGVGQFLKKRLTGAKPIINNAKALKEEQYDNLKTQLYYKLSELVNDGSVKCAVKMYQEPMTEELQQVRYKPSNREGKLAIVEKGLIKRQLGRSPDFSDAMAYRMLFEFNKASAVQIHKLGVR